MTDTGIDAASLAGHRLSMAAAAAERGEQKAAEMSALVSIAASLRQIADRRTPGSGAFDPAEADDLLLEEAFGIICNANNSIGSGGQLHAEWNEAARRFIDGYNKRVSALHGDQRSAD